MSIFHSAQETGQKIYYELIHWIQIIMIMV